MSTEPVRKLIEAAEHAAGAPMPLNRLDFVAWQDRDLPARRWMVRDWIPLGHVTSLYGDGGAGKSLVAQMLMASCATGVPWFSREVMQCKVLGLFCEDDEGELLRRQEAINNAHSIDFCDLEQMIAFSRVGEDNALMTFDREGRGELTPLWHRIVEEVRDFGAQLVVVDTAADTFGGDELKRPQVRQFISTCLGRIAREIDGAVLLCAHPSLSGLNSGTGAGGSTAWNNTVRSRLYLERPPAEDGEQADPDARLLTTKKANYAATGSEIRLRWRNGAFVLDSIAGGNFVEIIDQRNREREVEGIFLACLREVQARGQQAADSVAARDRYAPKLLRTLPAGRKCSFNELKLAMDRLLSAGKVRVASVRTPGRNYVSALVEVVASDE